MQLRAASLASVLVLIVSGIFIRTPSAAAQEPCQDALVMAHLTVNNDYSRDFRLAKFVSSTAYERARKRLGASGIVDGLPLGANYGDYHSRALSVASSTSEEISENQATNIEMVGLDPNAPNVYGKCIKAVLDENGLHIQMVGANVNAITVEISWHPQGQNEPSVLPITWTSVPPMADAARLPKSITQGEERVLFPRPPEEETIAVNAPGFTDSTVLTPLPPPPPPPVPRNLRTLAPTPDGEEPIVASVVGPDTRRPVLQWENQYPPIQCYHAPTGETFVPVKEQQYPGQDTNGGPPRCNTTPPTNCEASGVRCWNIHLQQGCDVSTKWLNGYRAQMAEEGKAYNANQICNPSYFVYVPAF